MSKRSTNWMVKLPSEVYAYDLEFKRPLNEQEVREYLRRYYNVKRMFKGTEVWIK